MSILVDSNVILDLFTKDPNWLEWSLEALLNGAEEEELVINPIIYAEISTDFSDIRALEQVIPQYFRREQLPWEAAFLAGKCFVEYRRRGGHKRSPLPDFFIGAHAAVRGMKLLTRDPVRYRKYFPKLEMIAPDGRVA